MDPVDRRDFMKSMAGAAALGTGEMTSPGSSGAASPEETGPVFLAERLGSHGGRQGVPGPDGAEVRKSEVRS